MDRRRLLKMAAFAPALPSFLARSAQALETGADYDGNVLVVVRLIGGNDGLNALIPVRDDAYYKARPTIAVPRNKALALEGSDMALNPALKDFHWLMEEGLAGVVQNVGYPKSSRSHSRATEIWEAGSTADKAPPEGWLGRYLDQLPTSPGKLAGVEFGPELGLTLASKAQRSRSIANPGLLLSLDLPSRGTMPGAKAASKSLQSLRVAQGELAETTRQLQRASKGSGTKFAYPDTAFGASLRWAGDMIEQGCPTRLFYVTLGSFDSGYSFDTHLDQLVAHQSLYSEFGQGLRAFAEHLKSRNQFQRVQLLTFSDFGRQTMENQQGGTDHGDASMLFAMGGRMKPGVHGDAPDIVGAYDGGLKAHMDFRQIYASVLESWLRVDAKTILGEKVQPYSLFA